MNKISNIAGLICLSISVLNAQINTGGRPLTMASSEMLGNIPSSTFYMDSTKISINDSNTRIYQYGIPNMVNIRVDSSGVWRSIGDNRSVLLYKIKCPLAVSTNFYFGRFHLPPTARMYIYNPTNQFFIGGFDTTNNRGNFEAPSGFGTGIVYGSDAIIEISVNNEYINQVRIDLNTVVYGYREAFKLKGSNGFRFSDECFEGINCPDGDDWLEEKKGVAYWLNHVGGSCTGTLINNQTRDKKLLFLTADHCLQYKPNPSLTKDAILNPNAPEFVFYWDYEKHCGDNAADNLKKYPSTSGATVITNGARDGTLLLLREDPTWLKPPVDLYFNGWDTRSHINSIGRTEPINLVGIHHPLGKPKMYSYATRAMISSPGQNFYELRWNTSKKGFRFSPTAQASSGSPLFLEENKLIIGYLSGGDSDCDETGVDQYNRFDLGFFGFRSGGSNVFPKRFKEVLDPNGSGITFLEGMPYCQMNFLTGIHSGSSTTNLFNCKFRIDNFAVQSGITKLRHTFYTEIGDNVEIKNGAEIEIIQW